MATLLVVVVIPYFLFFLPFWGFPFGVACRGTAPLTPAWALECWLWEDDVNTAKYVWELLDGYAEHDIPVRTILIDSPWSTRYNDFIVDENLYPDPARFFADLQDRGYRVVLWMTCMVNRQNSDTLIRDAGEWHREATDRGYLVEEGRVYKWWKGRGGLIDYSNPEAMSWWRGLQQQVFDWGIDGWKLDGAATYCSTRIGSLPLPFARTHQGWISTRGYMDHYYRDEYEHGLTQNPEFVTLSRSIDSVLPWVHPWGFSPLDSSPVNWVGDTQHVWNDKDRGLERALRTTLRSAKLGYNVIGSDIGGYHGKMPIPPSLYIRWAQFSTFCGFFLNGGHGERALWKRSPEELEIIRKFSWLHTELVPYMYSHVVNCHHGGKPLQRPIQGKYHYLFGDDLLIAPIYQDSLRNAIHLPKGKWHYFFNDTETIEGPKLIERDFPLDEYPVYVRDGAIIPMRISRSYTGIGDRDWESFLTLNIYPSGTSIFEVHHPEGGSSTLVTVEEGATLGIRLEGAPVAHILRVLLAEKPARVLRDQTELAEGSDWEYQSERRRLILRSKGESIGGYIIERN